MTAEKIRAKYKKIHDEMEAEFYPLMYAGLIDDELKTTFDIAHGQNWADMEAELIAEGCAQALQPPNSTHISVLESIDVGRARPAKVKRVWEGKDYFYDCFVTENIKDQYVNGDIKVGDYLLVLFEMGEQIVTAKVFKSW